MATEGDSQGQGVGLWQGAMVRELFKLAEKSQKQQQKPAGQGRLQQWYFFSVAAFWMYFRRVRWHAAAVCVSMMRLSYAHS